MRNGVIHIDLHHCSQCPYDKTKNKMSGWKESLDLSLFIFFLYNFVKYVCIFSQGSSMDHILLMFRSRLKYMSNYWIDCDDVSHQYIVILVPRGWNLLNSVMFWLSLLHYLQVDISGLSHTSWQYWIDCHYILQRYSWFPEVNSEWPC